MSWEEEYRAKHDEEEELAVGQVSHLQARIAGLEKELKRRHRRAATLTWVAIFSVIAFEIWYYSRH